MHLSLTTEIREILAATKTNAGTTFAEITGHISVAFDNVETAEVATFIVTGFTTDPGVPAGEEEEVIPVWLHKYSWGWIIGLDSGDQYGLLN